MVGEVALRFLVGGVIVSLFSVVGELFEPKTFAGIFGAAPSVALVTLTMAAIQKGRQQVATQTHAMIFGALAMLIYSVLLSIIVRRFKLPAWLEAGLVWMVWFAVAAALWWGCLT